STSKIFPLCNSFHSGDDSFAILCFLFSTSCLGKIKTAMKVQNRYLVKRTALTAKRRTALTAKRRTALTAKRRTALTARRTALTAK
ncbi:unnamed protein product, partial [Larinioides sclopetarius]